MTTEGNNNQAAAETVAKAEYDKAIERAQRFEGMVKDLEVKMSSFKGIDPEKHKALEEELNILKRDQAVGDPKKFDEELTRREKDIRASVEKETTELRETVQKLSSENKELKVTNKVFAIAASQLVDGAQDDCKDYIRRYCDINEAGEIIVKDSDGKPKYKKGSTTQLMGPDDFIDWLKENRGHWFAAKGKPGVSPNGTTVNSNGSGAKMTAEQWLALTPQERMARPVSEQREYARMIIKH